jgi:hypothetical protein
MKGELLKENESSIDMLPLCCIFLLRMFVGTNCVWCLHVCNPPAAVADAATQGAARSEASAASTAHPNHGELRETSKHL